MNATSSTNIMIVGASERTASAIELFFKRSEKGNYRVVSRNASSDILIADLDNFQQRESIVRARQANPDVSAIYLSVKADHSKKMQEALDFPASQLIQKPLTHKKLTAALDVAVSRLQKLNNKLQQKSIEKKAAESSTDKAVDHSESQPEEQAAAKPTPYKNGDSLKVGKLLDRYTERAFIGSLENISFSDEKQLKSATYTSDIFLQHHLVDAAKLSLRTNSIVQMSVLDCTILINPQVQVVKINGNIGTLFSLAKMPMQSGRVAVSRIQDEWESVEGDPVTLDSLLWHVTLLAARGRVPKGTDFHQRFRLKYWPNMTRLTLFPHALRVAALWTRGYYSLVQTAGLLNVEHRFIFSFYSAAKAIGLIQLETTANTLAKKVNSGKLPNNGKQRGFLARLLNHIKSR